MHSNRAGIPPLLKDDQTFTDSQDKANILNHYFCSVFSHDNNDDFPYIGDSPFPNMPPIKLHYVGINKVLKSLDPSKAAGPDGLPSRYLKLIADELTPSLFLLFSASLQQGRIPADWKRAHYLQLEVTCTHSKKIINQQECMGKLSLGYI